MDEASRFRFVAMKMTVHWGKNWVIFPNFLAYFLKKTFGPEWGERERSKDQHPVFRWLQKTQGPLSEGLLGTAMKRFNPTSLPLVDLLRSSLSPVPRRALS